MKAAAIWITRRLPTRVRPINPAFSLTSTKHNNKISHRWGQTVIEKEERHGELRLELKVWFCWEHLRSNSGPSECSESTIQQNPNSLPPDPSADNMGRRWRCSCEAWNCIEASSWLPENYIKTTGFKNICCDLCLLDPLTSLHPYIINRYLTLVKSY